MDALLEPATLAVTIRALKPILLLAYAGYLSQRAGVFNIALEGHLLLSAFFAVWGSFTFGSPAAGVLAAVAAGVVYSLLLA